MEPEEYLEGKENFKIVVDENGFIVDPPVELCERCYQDLNEGEHGHLICPLEPRRSHNIISDEIVGGMVMEHVYVGRKVHYKSELKQLLAAKGWKLADSTTEANHAKFLKERGEYAGDTQKERDRERLKR